jgi:hypothetical protein
MPAQSNPNMPTASVDDSKYMRMGHTAGPFGQDPDYDRRGEFGEAVKDLRP